MAIELASVLEGFTKLLEFTEHKNGFVEVADLIKNSTEVWPQGLAEEEYLVARLITALLIKGEEFKLLVWVFSIFEDIWSKMALKVGWLPWLLKNRSLPLSAIKGLRVFYDFLTPEEVFTAVWEDYEDDPDTIDRALDLMESQRFTREDYMRLIIAAGEYPRSQQLLMAELIARSDFRPVPAWVKFEAPHQGLPVEVDYFSLYGPRNWSDEDNPLDGRMLIFNEGREGWFRGFCQSCFGRIRQAEHAIRLPKEKGWKGCFCSFSCAVTWRDNEGDLDIVALSVLVKLCQEINQGGIISDPIEPPPPRAAIECDAIREFFKEAVISTT